MKKETGFTLIELMVTMVIFVMIATIGVPSLKNFLDNKRLSVVGPVFERSILFARSEARKRTEYILITPLDGDGNWAKGWKVERQMSADDVVLIKRFSALPGEPSFTSDDFTETNPIVLKGKTGNAQTAGSLQLSRAGCPDNVKYVYKILLSGDVSWSTSTCE